MDTYETVRNVITAYYQSRHVTGFRSLSDNGTCHVAKERKGKRKVAPLGKGMKGRGKWSPLGKGKGRGKLHAFGPLKGSKGKGKWNPFGKSNSEGGKSLHTGKGKDRIRCWKCGHHGHFEKDCKNVAAVTEENEELYDENDWTGLMTSLSTMMKTGWIGRSTYRRLELWF